MIINLKLVKSMSKFLKNFISPHVDDFPVLFHRFILEKSLFRLNWAKKGGLWPKYSIGLVMVDFILVTGISKFLKNTISPYVDDFSALFRRFISKNSLFSLNWAKKGDFGPNLALNL